MTEVLFSYSFVKLRQNFRKLSYFLVNLRKNFLIFSYKVLNFLIFVSRNSETCNRNDLRFWVTEVSCSYMYLKILLQFRNFIINAIKILLQFSSFKIHIMKIQLSFIILRAMSEISVNFSIFKMPLLKKIS